MRTSFQNQTFPRPKEMGYPPCRALPPGQQPYPNPNFIKDALLTSDPLTFLSEFPEDSVSLKKLGKLSKPTQKNIMSTCFIPERNLFLVLPSNSKTIYIYNSIKNFKLIATRTAEIELTGISYSKELDKILIGGCYLQIWNPITFKTEAQSPNILQNYEKAYTLVYLPGPDVIVAKTSAAVYTYGQDLKMRARFQLPPNGCVISSTAELFEVSQDLILAVCHFQQPRSLLLNLKKETVKELDQLYIPYTSCVERTQETPNKVFTCLTSLTPYPRAFPGQLSSFKLTQFTIDCETEQLVISRVTKTDHSFNSLNRLKDKKCFLAEGYNPSNISELFLLSIEKDEVEVVRVISGLTNSLGRYYSFSMVESVIFHCKEGVLYLYGCSHKREKEIKPQKLDIDYENYDLA